MMEKEKKKIIIDTDCGSDDAMAIAMYSMIRPMRFN